MYIRSQDKRILIPLNNLAIVIGQPYDNYKKKTIIGHYTNVNQTNSIILGHYKTDERCFDVLDDIQQTLQECFVNQIFESTDFINYKNGVYTMPIE